MTKLSVNLNKVATLRNTRTLGIPSIIHAAKLCLRAGADGITVHPRPDQRHIRTSDVTELATFLKNWPTVEFNIEGNPFHGYMELVEQVRPAQCTLVPDSPDAFTSDHGWDVIAEEERLHHIIATLKGYGCRVSLFMDPIPKQIERAVEIGADRIELYTEPYAAAFAEGNGEIAVSPYAAAAQLAATLGLGVNAGHDLNRENLPLFLSAVPNVLEVSIGHALIADALELGLPETVRQYLELTKGH
ncbi:MAG: pyridoxine 5'-phosphate synthase [Armatimonadetes bacterium]|nr:pyridoxine 5'-phosphate synthase [Armatimonadota bacterium]